VRCVAKAEIVEDDAAADWSWSRSDRRILVRGGGDRAYLAGGVLQFLVAQLRRYVVLLGQREESPEPKRLFKEGHRRIERRLPFRDRKGDLLGEARADVVVGAHAEGIEAQRLLPLARHGYHDRRPHDLVVAAGQPPVGMEQDLQVRAGIDMMPAAPVL